MTQSQFDGANDLTCLPTVSGAERSVADRSAPNPFAAFEAAPRVGQPSGFDLHEYIRIALKHRIVIGVCCLLCLATALAYSLTATPIYSATSTIQIDPKTMKIVEKDDVIQTSSTFEGTREDLFTQLQLLASRRLAERVVGRLNLTDDDDFMGKKGVSLIGLVTRFFSHGETKEASAAAALESAASRVMLETTISPFPQTTMTRITISDRSPQRARDIANGMAEEFIGLNLDRRVEATAYARKFLEDQLAQLKVKLEASERELIAFTQQALEANVDQQKRSVEYSILERETNTTRTLYDDLLDRYKNVGVAGSTGVNNVSLVDRALVPEAPTSPRTTLNLIVGLVFGLLIGVGVAILREHLDDRLVSPEEVEHASNLVTIGIIPRSELSRVVDELQDPHSVLTEAYRSLATSLQFSTATGLPKSLLITSASPGEGTTATVVNVAKHFANVGLSVLVIDCDLRKPTIHAAFKRPNQVGVSSVLAGRCTMPEALQPTDQPNLALISSGPLPPNPAELLSGPKFEALLKSAMKRFNFVIVDAAPVMGLADLPIVSNKTAATLLVVAANQCSRMALRKALSRLWFARAHVIGTVITKFDVKTAGYGYGYRYGYGYGYGNGGQQDYSYGGQIAKDDKVDDNQPPLAS